MTITSPGVLSAQVLRLLTRANLWSGEQAFSPGALMLVSDLTPPLNTIDQLYNVGGNLYWNGALVTTAAGVGTVTSVGLTAPAIFLVSGSPVVSTGTLVLDLATQGANRVWAGPATGSDGVPTFRALTTADIPQDITISGVSNVTWASVDKTGSSLADLATRSASVLNTGLLALARLTDNGTLGAPLTSSGGGTPSYTALNLALVAACTGLLRAACFPALTGDVTSAGGSLATTLAASGVAAGSYGSASAIPVLTIDGKGRITAATTASLVAAFAPSLITGAVRGSVMVGNATPVYATLTPSVVGQVLRYDGVDSGWSTDGSGLTNLNASALSTGSVPVAVGGTGLTAVPSAGQVPIGNGTGFTLATLTGTANQVLVTNAAGAVTLATPQAIATSSTPQFARVGLGTGADSVAALYTFGPHKHRVVANGSSGAALALDFSTADVHTVTLSANCTFTFSAPVAGVTYKLFLLQDGTGSRTVTWPTIKWTGGAAPTLTTTVAKTDVITLEYDGTSYYGSSSLNY